MYTVRIALLVPLRTRLSADEAQVSIGNLSIKLQFDGRYHVLLAQGFPSEPEASDFLAKLNASVACLLLEKGVAAEASLQRQALEYYEDPIAAAGNLSESLGIDVKGPIDGIVDGSEAAIYLSTKKLRFATFGEANAYVTIQSDQALDTIVRGAMLPGSLRLLDEPKLITALKLYGAYFTEQSATARFLTLIMSLEALATPTPKAIVAIELLERWSTDLQMALANASQDSEDAAALNALQRELSFRKDDSIRSQIRKLVLREFAEDPDVNAQAREALRLYDLRSTLVHHGFLEVRTLDTATADAKLLVHRVLQNRFQRITDSV